MNNEIFPIQFEFKVQFFYDGPQPVLDPFKNFLDIPHRKLDIQTDGPSISTNPRATEGLTSLHGAEDLANLHETKGLGKLQEMSYAELDALFSAFNSTGFIHAGGPDPYEISTESITAPSSRRFAVAQANNRPMAGIGELNARCVVRL